METYVCPAFYLAETIISRSIPQERFNAIMTYYKSLYGNPDRHIVTDMMYGDSIYCVERDEYYKTAYIGELPIDGSHSMVFQQKTIMPSFKYQPQNGVDHIRQRVEYIFCLPSGRLVMEILIPNIGLSEEDAISYSFKLYVLDNNGIHESVKQLINVPIKNEN